jgi:glycerol-3-phosphate O-acyltransferase / dihydroxyacetone phosphate acyltransferase
MMHLLLRNLMKLALRVYFRKVHVLNEAIIAANHAGILVANHPNGMMDILALGTLLSKNKLHFLVPAEMMNTSWRATLLKAFRCIPAERAEDKLSMQTLGNCSNVLKNKGKLIVFAEQKSRQAKRLSPLSLDASQIALEVEDSYGFGLDIKVFTVGLNYTYFNLFRSELMISLAHPIACADFKNKFQENKEQAFFGLNENISKELEGEMVIIEQEEHEIISERLLTINRNDCEIPTFPWKSRQQDKLRFDQVITGFSNTLATNDTATLSGISQKTSDYFGLLASYGINDRELSAWSHKSLLKLVIVFLGWPFFCIGYITNILPLWLAGATSKSSVEDVVWHEADRLFKGLWYWIGHFLLLTTTAYFLGGLYAGLTAGIMIPVSGFFALYFREWGKFMLDKVRYFMAKSAKPDMIAALRQQREEIILMMIKKPTRKPVKNIDLTNDLRFN